MSKINLDKWLFKFITCRFLLAPLSLKEILVLFHVIILMECHCLENYFTTFGMLDTFLRM